MSKLALKTQGSSNTGKGGWEVELGPGPRVLAPQSPDLWQPSSGSVGGYPGEGKGLMKKTLILGLSYVTLLGAG